VRPVVHYMMGGVHTDLDGRTALPGLFAAGETACVSINGANRLGSNSLTEILVFGARAGKAAAEHAAASPAPGRAAMAEALVEEERLEALLTSGERGGGERLADLRREMQTAMEAGAGIYRDAAGLAAAAETIGRVQARAERLALEDSSRTFNTERIAALELQNLLDVAEAMIHSALARRESRGAHQRTDFPQRDDTTYLAHSLAHRRAGGPPEISYRPVTVTRWPPGERVYGR
jgi:fumarate reductase flavoprotein subunit